MGMPKRLVVTEAFTELGLAQYAFDIGPEELQAALRKLDAMMAMWDGKGVHIGYVGGDGQGDINAETGVPAWADDAIISNLAVRLAPQFGKTVAPETRQAAMVAFNVVQAKTAQSKVRSLPGYAGAGNDWNPGFGNTMPESPQPIDLSTDDTLEFRGAE